MYQEEGRKTFRARKQEVFERVRKSGGSDFSSQIKLEEQSSDAHSLKILRSPNSGNSNKDHRRDGDKSYGVC